MNNEIYDYKLQSYLKGVIRKLPYEDRLQLKNISLCNVNAMQVPRATTGVYLLKSAPTHEAKLFGQVTCKNPFACPCCTAKMMSKYRSEIGATIEAMRAKGYFGFMITFTIAHLKFMQCREVTDILYNTWKIVFANCTNKQRSHGYRPMREFYQNFNIKHRVRVCEYTYSLENGWHPHFHVLFWVKKEDASKILDWEEQLNKQWEEQALKKTEQYWKQNHLHEENFDKCLKAITSCYERQQYTSAKALFISRDSKTGEILEAQASDYICGWGSDSELTGNTQKKASHEGHFTPYQILEKAAAGDKKFENLYVEFMLQVTRKPVHHRVDYSQSKLHAITTLYKNTKGYKELLQTKKKLQRDWQVIGFFLPSQWSKICQLNLEFPFISNLLYIVAHFSDDILHDYLKFYNIKIHPPELSTVSKHIENIFNGVTKEDLANAA